MIAGNPEAIALVINTEARMQGVLQARAGLNELGGTIDKMSPRIRTAANAATTLSFALSGAGGSAQSMAIAAGTLTSSLATLATSAKVAAAASGIGALVVVIASVAGWFRTAGAEAKKAGEEFQKTLKGMVDATDVRRLSQAAAQEFVAIRLSENRTARLKEELRVKATARDYNSLELQSLGRKIDKEEALTVTLRARYHATLKGVEIATAEAVSNTASAISIDRWTTAQAAAAQAAERSLEARRKLLEMAEKELAVDRAAAGSRVGTLATEKAAGDLSMNLPKPIGGIDATRAEAAAAAARAGMAVMATIPITPINAAGDAVLTLKDRFDLLRTSVVFAGEAMKDAALGAVESYTRGGESALKALKRLALEPIVKKLEGLAASEAVEALVAAAHLNLPKAALHAAGAAAAAVAARKVASLGGLSSGASGGGGYGGGGGNVGTFRPSLVGGGGGGQTVNIIVRDAAGRDQVAETIHNLNRARSLNVSGLPPTRGVDVRVA